MIDYYAILYKKDKKMPVLTMSTTTAHTIKGHKRYNKLVNQRNQVNQRMSNIGSWKNNVEQTIRKSGEDLNATLKNGWERHNQAIQKGLNGDGQFSTFNHKQGNTTISGKIGAHKGNSSHNGWNTSSNNLSATLADAAIHTGGDNWDFDGRVQLGDLSASMNHTILDDNITISKGLENGPKASIRGSAEVISISGTGSVGTDKDASLGIRLQGHIHASWGVSAGINMDSSNGLSPFHLSNLGPQISGDVNLVIDHQISGSDARKEIAKVKMNNGKLDANINWRELGDAIPDVLSNGINIV